jgi:hypothetical protein
MTSCKTPTIISNNPVLRASGWNKKKKLTVRMHGVDSLKKSAFYYLDRGCTERL